MLTREMLKSMPANTIFATGIMLDNEDGLNMNNSNQELRWCAVRGGIDDWAIYCHFADKSIEWIHHYGDKIYDEYNIKRCVLCNDEAFARYRH